MRFAIIIGAQRAGTTSLFQYLRQHPEIAGCSARKQTDFFTANWNRSLEWYRSLWEWNPNEHQWALEASPSYTMVPHKPNAAKRIATIDTDFRFIYLLRDPVDRIRSHYHHGLYCGEVERGLSFAEAIRQNSRLLDHTRYATQLSKYDDLFSRGDIFLTTLERLKSEPPSVLREICEFLGVDPRFEFSNYNRHYNSRESRGNASFIYRTLRSLSPLRNAVRKWVPLWWRDQVREVLYEQDDEVEYPEPTSEDQMYVLKNLSDELEALRSENCIDISHWSFEKYIKHEDS